MSVEIPVHHAKKFGSGIDLLQQQMGSRLEEGVDVDSDVQGGDRKFYDQVDAVEMLDITDRHGHTQYVNTPHRRRMAAPSPAEWADRIDRSDLRRVMNDPQSSYARSAAAAVGRKKDRVVINAFFAAASTGVDGATSAAFPTATHTIAVVAGGLTIAQLLDARRILESFENPEDDGMNRWYAALAAQQRRNLLNTTEVSHADYNTVRSLVNGQVDQFLGFKFLKSQLLGVDGSSDQRCPFWRKASMKLAVAQEGRPFIDILPEHRHSIQLRYELDVGATRMDEKGVVEVIADL